MPVLLRRGRVQLLIAASVLGVGGFSVALVHSRTPGCDVGAPDIRLPAQLATLGELDQPFDSADLRSLADASAHAGTALYSDLAGAQPGQPVAVGAAAPAVYDAFVVPLSEQTADGSSKVVGLVVYLRDCNGRAYFNDVADLLHLDPSTLPQTFPTLSADQARARLGAATVRLEYVRTPLQPAWVDPATGRRVGAGPPLR